MSTMTQIVDSVLAEVYGGTSTIDTSTYLVAVSDADDLTFSVSDASGFSRGIIQVGDELILIDSVNRSTNVLTCGNVSGRGIRGTTAAQHEIGDRVIMSPSISRIQAINAVEQTLKSSTGLFAVGTTSFPCVSAQVAYTMPAEAEQILSVLWLPYGPTLDWVRVRRYTLDRVNSKINIGDVIMPGQTIKVTYTKAPTVPTQSEDFSVTGLPASCEDVIRFGAAWRIVSFLEPMNLLAQSAEADAMDRQNTSGSRIRVAQYLYGMYQQRLAQEIGNLQTLYPTYAHFGG